MEFNKEYSELNLLGLRAAHRRVTFFADEKLQLINIKSIEWGIYGLAVAQSV